jgi:hypothetical protein
MASRSSFPVSSVKVGTPKHVQSLGREAEKCPPASQENLRPKPTRQRQSSALSYLPPQIKPEIRIHEVDLAFILIPIDGRFDLSLLRLRRICTINGSCIFAFSLPFHILPRYPAGMRVLLRQRQALVQCKGCQASIPSLTRGRPVLPTAVLCSLCGAKRAYRPSEVSIGTVGRVWK